MVEQKPSKLMTTVRFRSPAPKNMRFKVLMYRGLIGEMKCEPRNSEVYVSVYEEKSNATVRFPNEVEALVAQW